MSNHDWQVDKLTSWQIDKLTSWHVDKLTSWQVDKLTTVFTWRLPSVPLRYLCLWFSLPSSWETLGSLSYHYLWSSRLFRKSILIKHESCLSFCLFICLLPLSLCLLRANLKHDKSRCALLFLNFKGEGDGLIWSSVRISSLVVHAIISDLRT